MASVSINKKQLPVIGLTGGIGTGKSTAAEYFKELGAKVIDADKVGRTITDNNEDVRKSIKSAFGKEFFDNNGNLNRKKLGDLVFSNKQKLETLNKILHPLMISQIKNEVKKFKGSAEFKMIIVDAAIIFELNLQNKFDFIVTVSSYIDECKKRIMKVKKISSKNFDNIVKFQLNPEIKEQKSDFVIKNNSTKQVLKEQVEIVFFLILAAFDEQKN